MNLSEGCCVVIVLENGDRGRLNLHANALIVGPLHCLDAFFCRFVPSERDDGPAGRRLKDLEDLIVLSSWVLLLTCDNVGVRG